MLLLLLPLVLAAEPPAIDYTPGPAVDYSTAPGVTGRVVRVEINRIWYDRHPDGRLDYCHECNKGALPAGPRITYEEAKALVREKFRIALAIGVPLKDVLFYGRIGYEVSDPPLLVEPGHYLCALLAGTPSWQRIGDPTPGPMRVVPEVAIPRPFRSATYDPDHTCNVCGRLVTVIAGWNPDGTHRHSCPCGNVWNH